MIHNSNTLNVNQVRLVKVYLVGAKTKKLQRLEELQQWSMNASLTDEKKVSESIPRSSQGENLANSWGTISPLRENV